MQQHGLNEVKERAETEESLVNKLKAKAKELGEMRWMFRGANL